jgi:hypothetical protein
MEVMLVVLVRITTIVFLCHRVFGIKMLLMKINYKI